jgi:hypothetical protein
VACSKKWSCLSAVPSNLCPSRFAASVTFISLATRRAVPTSR